MALSGGNLTNSGLLQGGNGGSGGSGGYSFRGGTGARGGAGVALSGGATLTNTGNIQGGGGGTGGYSHNVGGDGGIGGAGVYLNGGTMIDAGVVSGGSGGGYAMYGTPGNSGVSGDAVLFGTAAGTLVVEAGAVFNGLVVANAAVADMLELSGAISGTLSGIGSEFTGFGNILVNAGSNWTLEGANSLAAGQTLADDGTLSVTGIFTNNGVITTDPATLIFSAAVTGSGTIEIGAGSNVIFESSVSAGETIVFLSNTGTLTIADPSEFAGTVLGTGTIVEVTCYAAGTRIATSSGPVRVEDLQIGNLVRTLHAGDQPIKWIGRRSYHGRLIAGNKFALPICINAGAIADNTPSCDLWVSPGHAISIDNMLIHASRLVNGVSIIQAQSVEEITYFHIELENHEIIFAENCPAETFMDEQFRAQFQNAAEFFVRYPDGEAPRLMCQPRLDSGFHLHAILTRLRARAGISAAASPPIGPLRGFVDQHGPLICCGWAQDMASPEEPVCLDIIADGQRIGRALANQHRADLLAIGFGSGNHGFNFTLPPNLTGRIEVRRSTGGEALPSSGAAEAHAA